MQLAVCATEGRARMLAKGVTAATPPGLLWRKVLSVSTAPPPQQSKEAGMGKGLRVERGSNGRDGSKCLRGTELLYGVTKNVVEPDSSVGCTKL